MALNVGMYGGKMLDITDLKPDDISIYDIGWALAQNLRFNGHTIIPYSVAEHCTALSLWVPEHLALVALLHDASEAYIGDVINPVKQWCPELVALEESIHKVIFEHFRLDPEAIKLIKPQDDDMCRCEAMQIMGAPDWARGPNLLRHEIAGPMTEYERRYYFFRRFEDLTGEKVSLPRDGRDDRGIKSYRAGRGL